MNIEPTTALRIALPVPLRQHFDYLPKEGSDLVKLQPGMRIKVPFQRRELIGIFIEYTQTPEVAWERLKPIIEVLDPTPLITDEIFKLARWAADYYHYPLGEVLVNALPVLLRKGQSKYSAKIKHEVVEPIPFLELNPAQSEAVQAINATDHFQVFLLNGVTGSGKTEVYLHVIQHTLKKEKQVLVLVPEIGLTPQTIQRFRERFQVPIIALHSGLTEKERLNAWHLSRLNEASIIIGTRSAVFSPFKNLGLIIIDEEHDLSFKQQDGFRYHARDIAIMRAHFANIPIVLGSATPSLETLYKAQKGKFKELQLTERTGNAQLPKFEILDIRNQALDNGLSQSLISQIKHEIDQQNQVILFLNRRGFAPIIMCHHCGWMIHCERCDMRMTYHQHSKRLHCHHCDSQKKLPHTCESCQGRELIAIGLGTERLEETLQKYFPEISIARMDRDNTQRKGSLENLLNRIQSGEDRILIGTQMLAKGHHFPNVTLVAVIDADGGFF